LYSDYANRDALLDLVRFKSSTEDGYVSFAQYKERMKDGQKSIYYITGGKEQTLKSSPLLEAYKKKGYEVLIMADDIDDFIIGSIANYKDIPLKAINKSGAVDDLKDEKEEKKDSKEDKAIVKKIKDALGEKVSNVVVSSRLVDSPAIVVVDENDPSVQMQQILRQMGQSDIPEAKPILEVNCNHNMVKKLIESKDDEYNKNLSEVLLGQAMLAQGVMPKDPVEFTKKLNELLSK
jgi:molecular chaperone HtpG